MNYPTSQDNVRADAIQIGEYVFATGGWTIVGEVRIDREAGRVSVYLEPLVFAIEESVQICRPLVYPKAPADPS